jgi:metallo-beta-lactamase class B
MKSPPLRAFVLACAFSLPAGSSFGQATPETASIPQPHLARALADAAGEAGWKHPALITCYPDEGQSAEHVIKDPGPAKAADNLYFLGNGIVAAWALDTSDGIILIDALNNREEADKFIIAGLT